MEEKQPFFVESSDSDIGKLVWNVVSEITKKTTNWTNQLKSTKYFGALQKFIWHHNLSV